MAGGGVDRRQALGTFVALPIAAATLPAPPPDTAIEANDDPGPRKIFEILARKPDRSREDFRRRWLAAEGTRTRKLGLNQGLVLSETFGAGAEATIGASYNEPIDGFAQHWLVPDEDVVAGSPASALSDTLIDESASRSFLLREKVVVPPPRCEGLVKRTLLLVRRADLSHEQFLHHWLTRHAQLARDVPGLIGAVFNPVLQDLNSQAPPRCEIDGVTETW